MALKKIKGPEQKGQEERKKERKKKKIGETGCPALTSPAPKVDVRAEEAQGRQITCNVGQKHTQRARSERFFKVERKKKVSKNEGKKERKKSSRAKEVQRSAEKNQLHGMHVCTCT